MSMYNNLQAITDNAIDIAGINHRYEIKPMNNYYEASIHESMQFLSSLIFMEAAGEELKNMFSDKEISLKAAQAIQVLSDFHLFVSMVDANLVAAEKHKRGK